MTNNDPLETLESECNDLWEKETMNFNSENSENTKN